MSGLKVKTCDFCDDGNGECIFPYYGLAPHIHTKPIGGTEFIDVSLPENFSPDGDGLGIYTHCLYCGGDGTYEGIKIEVKAESKEAKK
ncbi:hypothetical protein NQ849_15130 [Acinetobacter baumannii]|nr:hypothetical protein [Acinetobacter baumannii]